MSQSFPKSGLAVDEPINHAENTAFPGWGVGNAVTVPSSRRGRLIFQAVNADPDTGTPAGFDINVETGPGTGVYNLAAQAGISASATTPSPVVFASAFCPPGCRYYFDTWRGTESSQSYSWADL